VHQLHNKVFQLKKLLCPPAFRAIHFKYTVVPMRQMGCIYEPAFI